MREFFAATVTLGVAFISAGTFYQLVKQGSQGPQVTGQLASVTTSLAGDLFK